ncbi:efflux RND transporter periplasmic adaptor subunit [Dinghuibacter silviterrae]|nr:efflux RND transporter periplasmic adaptor subunit [Dinghuibacter silviterrae]
MNRVTLLIPFIILLAACGHQQEADPAVASAAAPHYSLAAASKTPVEQVEQLPAQLAAYQEVSIFPKVNGYVQSVLVDIGSHVRQGQLLMVLVAPELEQATLQAKEKFERAKADFTISKEEYERLTEAAATPGAVSPLQLAAAKAKASADSSLANAERANWQQQQVMGSYLNVTAPFTGVITARNVHPGALVSAAAKDAPPMLELKQIEHLRLQVDIPEHIAEDLRNSDTLSFYLTAYPGKAFTGRIARKSMNISPQFRSERVELDVYNQSETLTPGMFATVLFTSKGNPSALSVPKSAVVTSTERKYVIVIIDGKTHKVDVSTGNQSASQIEVFGALNPGDSVIANANDEIKDNITIKQ